ncbi:cytochrome c oxidase subunit 2 [Paenibacillus sp. UNCCL117]|uniref:cupredoxin domain-containing protein n=1 Tax=unclassified Paenibacillus TaxID=185978 RepID=UPI00087F6EFA|nr:MULTISPECIES: cupredoxin domain-containing protein [unclassified Paenibacillus]SDC00162.1 cytochrome c oxidase subunit 2 [Paenibacillus sp. cl123]SFW36300.1 cytochrome c oxidase subunit 2 [Paenibacillus sp. UNCCL117]
MKKWIVSISAIALIAVMTACGAKPEAAPAPSGQSAPASGGAGQQVKLVATNYQFDQKEYKVKKGEDVTFTLENKAGLHGVAINGLNVELKGDKLSATVKPDKAGTYDIICSIPCGSGHISMKSKLIVE